MKRFLLILMRYGCYLLLVLAAWLMLPDRYSRSSHEANVRLASERIKVAESPKIVLIGGSGCQFGFVSELLEEHFHRPVINTGAHACLGLQLQVNLFRDAFRPGDLVVLIPEYDQYSVPVLFSGCLDESMLRIMLSNYPKGLTKLTRDQWYSSLPFVPRYMAKTLLHFTATADPWSPYSVKSINQYGDETNWENRPAWYKDNPHIEHIIDTPYEEALFFLRELKDECQKDSVTLLLFPPALAKSEYDYNTAYIEKLQTVLAENSTPFCALPDRYCLPDSLYFDSYYHMTYEGAYKRTKMVIEDIEKNLKQE